MSESIYKHYVGGRMHDLDAWVVRLCMTQCLCVSWHKNKTSVFKKKNLNIYFVYISVIHCFAVWTQLEGSKWLKDDVLWIVVLFNPISSTLHDLSLPRYPAMYTRIISYYQTCQPLHVSFRSSAMYYSRYPSKYTEKSRRSLPIKNVRWSDRQINLEWFAQVFWNLQY